MAVDSQYQNGVHRRPVGYRSGSSTDGQQAISRYVFLPGSWPEYLPPFSWTSVSPSSRELDRCRSECRATVLAREHCTSGARDGSTPRDLSLASSSRSRPISPRCSPPTVNTRGTVGPASHYGEAASVSEGPMTWQRQRIPSSPVSWVRAPNINILAVVDCRPLYCREMAVDGTGYRIASSETDGVDPGRWSRSRWCGPMGSTRPVRGGSIRSIPGTVCGRGRSCPRSPRS